MRKYTPEANHTDDRGDITDLCVGMSVNAITVVRTKKGAIRGNHYHPETRQWAYIAAGRLRATDGVDEYIAEPGDVIYDRPGSPHAWEALEDTVCLVWVHGPRAGEGYAEHSVNLKRQLIPT